VADYLQDKVFNKYTVCDTLLMVYHNVDLLCIDLKTVEIGLRHIDNNIVLAQ
jgi:hypothetical protein